MRHFSTSCTRALLSLKKKSLVEAMTVSYTVEFNIREYEDTISKWYNRLLLYFYYTSIFMPVVCSIRLTNRIQLLLFLQKKECYGEIFKM